MKPKPCFASAVLLAVALAAGVGVAAQQPDPAWAEQPPCHSPEWLKTGVIYQIFVGSFSPSGDLNGVTARLDDLRSLNGNRFGAHIFEKVRQDQS